MEILCKKCEHCPVSNNVEPTETFVTPKELKIKRFRRTKEAVRAYPGGFCVLFGKWQRNVEECQGFSVKPHKGKNK